MSAPETGLGLHGEALPSPALVRLLTRQCKLYTMDESSSLPEQTVRALLASLLYTLNQSGLPSGAPDELETRLADGQRLLAAKQRAADSLWQQVNQTLPALESEPLRETLASIGTGFRRYDARFFAHEFPCQIDYPLCSAVPETQLGLDYLLDYLRRIDAENSLLRRFSPRAASRVLSRDCAAYAAMPVNLSAPVLVQALGLVLLGRAPLPLSLGRAEQAALLAQLELLSPQALRAQLLRAVDRLCRALAISEPFARQYWMQAALAEAPRMAAAAQAGDLSAIFLAV